MPLPPPWVAMQAGQVKEGHMLHIIGGSVVSLDGLLIEDVDARSDLVWWWIRTKDGVLVKLEVLQTQAVIVS